MTGVFVEEEGLKTLLIGKLGLPDEAERIIGVRKDSKTLELQSFDGQPCPEVGASVRVIGTVLEDAEGQRQITCWWVD